VAHPKITLERSGKAITAKCGQCDREITESDKRLAVQKMIGHLAGSHRKDLTALLNGDINVIDNT